MGERIFDWWDMPVELSISMCVCLFEWLQVGV